MIATASLLLSLLTCNPQMDIYPMSAVVTRVETSTGRIFCQSPNGNEWIFLADDADWQTGDIVACMVCDGGTPEITDDSIVSVRYEGNLSSLGGYECVDSGEIYEEDLLSDGTKNY